MYFFKIRNIKNKRKKKIMGHTLESTHLIYQCI